MSVEVKYVAGATIKETVTEGSQDVTIGPIRIGMDTVSIADGAGAGAASKVKYDQISLAASGTATIDLTSWTTGVPSSTTSFSGIKGLLIRSNGTAGADTVLTVGNATATPFAIAGISASTATLKVKSGGFLFFYDPSADGQTTSSANNLKIANDSATTTVTVDVIAWGE